MDTLPTRHVPRMLRGPAVRRKVERPVAYGVGEEHHPGEFGMYAGPFPTLAEALDVVGRPDGRVVRFNADGTDTVLYRWDEAGGAWDLDARVLQ